MSTLHSRGCHAAALALCLGVAACEETYLVTVTNPRGSAPLPVGEVVQLEGVLHKKAFDLFGGGIYFVYASRDRPGEFRWYSSAAGVATVSERGELRALSPGTTMIQAATRGVVSPATPVTVVAP